MPPVLQLSSLRKSYGDTTAVEAVSFAVQRNEIVGLLGPNGAGKTTTINMILGVLAPDQGRVEIAGIDLAKHRRRALLNTNFAAVYAPLPGNLTVIQNLRFFGDLYAVPDLPRRIDELLAEYDLERFRDSRCGVLSSGEQTRVALAKAMLNRPRLLLLDEPTASLDPATAREVRDRIRAFAASGEAGVLWTSHNMFEVEDVCHPRAVPVARQDPAGGRSKTAAPRSTAKRSLEDLFVAVAREPLSLEAEASR